MAIDPPKASRLWGAMLRHGVVQAGLAYLVVGWLLIQVAEATFDDLGLPPWSGRFVTYEVIGGFALVVLMGGSSRWRKAACGATTASSPRAG